MTADEIMALVDQHADRVRQISVIGCFDNDFDRRHKNLAEAVRALVAAIQQLVEERDRLERENKELLDKAENWAADLSAISDDPIKGDPMKTVGLVLKSIDRIMDRLKRDGPGKGGSNA